MIRLNWKKITAVALIVSFSSFELGFAQPLPVSELLQQVLPETAVEKKPEPSKTLENDFFVSDSLSFLESDKSLSKVNKVRGAASSVDEKAERVLMENKMDGEAKTETLTDKVINQTRYEDRPERVSFEEALDQLQPEYASALMIRSLTAENAEQLTRLSFETALVVLNGEIILFSTGNQSEIGVTHPAHELLAQASFISHVHTASGEHGASSFDLQAAVQAPAVEYVVTPEGVYAYNGTGVLNDGRALLFHDYVALILEAQRKSTIKDSNLARSELNLFIAEMDQYNALTAGERLVFRRGNTLVETFDKDAEGVIVRRVRIEKNEAGKTLSYDDIRYTNTRPTIRWHYEYDLEGRFTSFTQDNYDGAGLLYMRTFYQYTQGVMVLSSMDTYYGDGTDKSRDATTYKIVGSMSVKERYTLVGYDEKGKVNRRVDHQFTAEGKNKSYDDTRYQKDIPVMRWYYEYDSVGGFSQVLEDRYFANGILESRSASEYRGGYLVRHRTEAYYANAFLKSVSVIDYWPRAGMSKQKVRMENFDETGRVTGVAELVYDELGTIRVYDDVRFLNDLRTVRFYYEYDAAGRFTLQQFERYDSLGRIQESTFTHLQEGKKKSYKVQTFTGDGQTLRTFIYLFDAAGTRLTDYYEYDYSNENLLKLKLTRYASNGTIASHQTIEILSSLKTAQSDYVLTYRMNGQVYTQNHRLEEGSNSINYLRDIDTAVEIAIDLKTSDFRLDLIQPLPARTAQRSLAVSYTAGLEKKIKILELLEGPNRFLISEKDTNGFTASLQVDVVLDTTPPRIVIIDSIPALTNNANLEIRYTSDTIEKTRYYVLQEGSNAITLSEKDDLGNESVRRWTIVLDTTPPEMVMTEAVPLLTNQSELVFKYTADGVAKEKRVSLAEGLNALELRETDAMGNESIFKFKVVLDSIAPEVIVTDSIPLKTKQALWTVRYTVDGSLAEKVFSLQEGSNTLEIEALDEAGNRNVKRLALEKDTTPPVIKITEPVPARTRKAELTIHYTLEGESQTQRELLVEGQNTLTLRAADELGNEMIKTLFVVLDTQAPEIIVTEAVPSKVKENTLNVHYTADGVEHEKAFSLAEGDNVLMLQAEDDVGNKAVKILEVRRDSIPPEIILTSVVPEKTNQHELLITYTADGAPLEKKVRLEEGVNALVIREQDDLGNETLITLKVTLDSTPPILELSPLMPARIRQNPLTVIYTADGVIKNKIVSLAEGVNSITLTEADELGNTVSQTYEFVLDTRGPALEWVGLIPEKTEHSFVLQYRVDGAVREKLWELQGLPGLRAFELIEEDDLGNESRLSLQVEFDPPTYEHTLEDGTVLTITDRVLRRETFANGDQVIYDRLARIQQYQYAEGSRIEYHEGAPLSTLELFDKQEAKTETIGELTAPALDEQSLIYTMLENGISIYYKEEIPVLIKLANNVRVYNFRIAGDGSITEALLVYPDRRLELIRNGAVLRTQSPNGLIIDYLPDGRAVRELSASGTGWYRYEKDQSARIVQTQMSIGLDESVTYGADGLLRQLKKNAEEYNYSRYETEDGIQLVLEKAIEGASLRLPLEFSYSKAGELQKILYTDASQAFFENGLLNRYTDAEGHEADYQIVMQEDFIQGAALRRAGAELVYDDQGFLIAIKSDQGTLYRSKQQTTSSSAGVLSDAAIVDILLETVGGDKLTDFELDNEGRILKGLLETKSGVKQTIENGVLTGFETVDGKLYGIRQNSLGASEAYLKEWKFKNGTRVIYGGGTIEEIIYPDGKRLNTIGFNAEKKVDTVTEELPDGTKRFFQNNKLIKTILPTGAEIHYGANGMAQRMTLPDASEESVTYTRDNEGLVETIIFTGRHVRRVFKADGTLLNLLAGGVNAVIENAQVSRFFTRFGEIQDPQFNSAGEMSGDVELVDGTLLRVVSGELMQVIKPNGTQLLYENGRVSRVELNSVRYELSYQINELGRIDSVNLHYVDQGVSVDVPLVPYLLAHPENELVSILFPRTLYNSLEERSEVRSSLSSQDLFFSKVIDDSVRGSAYEFGSKYFPEWDFETLSVDPYLAYPDSGNNFGLAYPITRSSLIDMNGDGRADRVYVDPDNTKWWVQLSNGMDFEAPIMWSGIQGPAGSTDYQIASIRGYDALSGAQLNDFLDLNGDRLPDRIMRSASDVRSWYVQYNTGAGFAPPVKVEGNIHPFIGNGVSDYASYAVGNYGYTANGPGAFFTDLTDMNGDGFVDRVILPKLPAEAVQDHWYIQYGKESGFEDPVLWRGVDSNLQHWQTGGEASSLGWYELGGSSEHSLSFAAIRAWSDTVFNEACIGAYTYRGRSYCSGGTTHKMSEAISEISAVFPFFGRFYSAYSGQSIGFDYKSETYQREMLETYDATAPKLMADQSKLLDMNGDHKPDRLMLSETGAWYIQLNNGNGFDAAVVWAESVRKLPNVNGARIASSIRLSEAFERDNVLTDLRDVTGDGLPDRVTMDQGPKDFEEFGFSAVYQQAVSWWKNGKNESGRLQLIAMLKAYEEKKAMHTWWVEVNNGSGFDEAVAWTGIYGNSFAETAITQNERVYVPTGYQPYLVMDYKKVTDLVDINGDKILDRVIYSEGSNDWFIQFGTGAGYLPVEVMKIESISASAASIKSSRYDYLHVSLRAEDEILSSQGSVKVVLGNLSEPETYQEWLVTNLTKEWKDFYLPLDKNKANGREIKVQFLSGPENQEAVPVYVDNVTFTAFHPSAAKDWLDELLVEDTIFSEVDAERNETLWYYLGLSHADSSAPDFNWDELLNAETTIHFNASGETQSFQNLYGAVSKVENGHVIETILPDGSKVQFEQAPLDSLPQTQTQRVTNTDGTMQELQLSYGRVRSVTREGKKPLEYSYEFNSKGQEITVVYDTETKSTERYLDNHLVERAQASGLITSFHYDALSNLTASEISYKGRVRQQFVYETAESGNQLVRTEEGVSEEYSKDGKLLFHTSPDGYRYAHTEEPGQKTITSTHSETTQLPDGTSFTVSIPNITFEPDPAGEKIYRVTLVDFQQPQGGDRAFYEADHFKSVRLADGTEISFDHFETAETTNEETGEIVQETKLSDVTVFHPDGTITEFKSGKPAAVVNAAGRTISLAMDGGYLINPNESAVFQKAQAEKLWMEVVLVKWQAYRPAPILPVQMEYASDGTLLTRKFGEGVSEIYEQGRIQQIVSPDGERLIEYLYDGEGNPTQIDMQASRRRLESAVLKLKAEVAVEKEKRLAYIADREQVLHETVEAQYTVARDRLLSLRSQIEEQANKLSSLSVKGKQAKKSVGNAMESIHVGLNQVDSALEELANQRIQALEQLSVQVRQASEDLAAENQKALTEINIEREGVHKAILKQEVSPVIYHWYRKILGRDPSQAEYERWINTAADGTGHFVPPVPEWLNALKTELNTSSELQARSAEVQAIKSLVTAKLQNYLTLSTAKKLALEAGLGIEPGLITEATRITADDANSVLSWLNSQSLHFGQSAYIALEALLQQHGYQKESCSDVPLSLEAGQCYSNGSQSFSRRQLATELILTDILTGTLTPLESGDLVLSLYAMQRFALRQGFSASALTLDFEALKTLYDGCAPSMEMVCPKTVAHINGNHYIIITKVTATEVNYIDPGAGADDALQTTTLSKEEFLSVWLNSALPNIHRGVVLSAKESGDRLIQIRPEQAAHLTINQQMAVRGAFFPLLIPIFIAIATAAAQAVVAAVTAIVGIISGVLTGIGSLISGIGSFIGGAFSGNLLAGLQGLFSGVLNGLGAIGGAIKAGFVAVHGALLGGIQGIAGSIPLLGGLLTSGTALELISQGLAFGLIGYAIDGAASLAERLGVSPKFARSIAGIGKVITGVGLLASGQVYGLGGSLSFITSGTSEFLNLHTNLSPILTNVIGIGAAAIGGFAGGGFDPQITGIDIFRQALPSLSMDLASAGISGIGGALGLDWRLSSLLSIPIQAGVGRIAGGQGNGSSLLSTLKNNFLKDSLSGVLSLGTSLALDKLNVPQSASGFINQYLGQIFSEGALGGITPAGQSAADKVFSSLAAGLQKFGSAVKTLTGNVLSFGQKVLHQTGQFTADAFKKALVAVSGLFDRKTQEALYQDLAGIREGTVREESGYWIWESGKESVVYDLNTHKLVEYTPEISMQVDDLHINDQGIYSHKNLTHAQVSHEGYQIQQRYEHGNIEEVSVYYKGINLVQILANSQSNEISTPADLFNISEVTIGAGAYFPKSPDQPDAPQIFAPLIFSFSSVGGQITKATVALLSSNSTAFASEDTTGGDLYVLVNGVLNDEVSGSPDYIYNMKRDIVAQSDKKIGAGDIITAAIFNKSPLTDEISNYGAARDILGVALDPASFNPISFVTGLLFGEAQEFVEDLLKNISDLIADLANGAEVGPLTSQIKKAMNGFFDKNSNDHGREMIGVAYSGGFWPLAEVLTDNLYDNEQNQGYNSKSLIGLGAASFKLNEASQWFVEKAARILEILERSSSALDLILDKIEKELIELFDIVKTLNLPFIPDDTVQTTVSLMRQGAVAQSQVVLADRINEILAHLTRATPPDLSTTNLDVLVNVYGQNDVLANTFKIGDQYIGGYRKEISGFIANDTTRPLINIEIIGASHHDYIRENTGFDFFQAGVLSGAADWFSALFSAEDRAWNKRVAEFVADLIGNSSTQDDLEAFLANTANFRHLANVEKVEDRWIVKLPGSEARVRS